jgi:hypothetical protein
MTTKKCTWCGRFFNVDDVGAVVQIDVRWLLFCKNIDCLLASGEVAKARGGGGESESSPRLS